MELKSLRKADFISSILIIAFGLFVTLMALQMPMEASYGGVQTHWYVAPALFPLCIGIVLMLLGALLLFVAIREGGARKFFDDLKIKSKKKIEEKTIRVWVVVLALASFIYLFIPYIDFVVSIATFLFFISSVFYSESPKVFRNVTRYFLIESFVVLILQVTGIHNILIAIYPYFVDAMAILALIGMNFYARSQMKADGMSTKKLTTVLLVAVITPMILCPIFRYLLMTPLPNEGIILDHLNVLYYSIKY